MDSVEVVYGPNGEAYLALRKHLPELLREKEEAESDPRGVIIIDMFEEDKVCYEC